MRRRLFIQAGLSAVALAACESIDTPLAPSSEAIQVVDAHTTLTLGNQLTITPQIAEHQVRATNAHGRLIWSYGTQGDGDSQLNGPSATVALPDGRVAIVDRGNRRIVVLTEDGVRDGIWPMGELGANDACVVDGLMYVTDTSAHQIHVLTTNGERRGSIGEFGTADDGLNGPRGIATLDGDLLICDSGNGRIVRMTTGGTVRATFGGDVQAMMHPRAVAVGQSGMIYVADATARRVFVFAPSGRFDRAFEPDVNGAEWVNVLGVASTPNAEITVHAEAAA